MIASKVFPTIYNNSNYRVKTITSYHPESMKYISYWRMHKKRVFEGCWIPDTKEVNIDLNIEIPYNELLAKGIKQWRWIPPGLYFYLNFGTILHKPENAPRTAPKQRIRPYLSDLELAFFYNWVEARGFSGFEDDEEYTCNRDLIIPDLEIYHPSCYNSKGDLKKYLSAREYLRRLSDKPLGRHLYWNEAKNLMLLSARGLGKDLEENTPVYSVNRGKIPIKLIEVGEYIYDADGLPTKVIDRFDFNNQMQYKITLADGRDIIAGEGHLWSVIDNAGKELIINTAKIRDNYKAHIRKKYNGNYNFDSRYFIPMNKGIQSPDVELPIDPYFLGIWLGDGNSHNTGITTVDEEIKEMVYKYSKIFENHKVTINQNKTKTCPTYTITNPGVSTHIKGNKLLELLRDLNLINNKHIPEIYLNSSFNQRLELLKGLMDSDGYLDKGGRHVEFSSSIEQLALDTIRLARSLGIRTEYSTRIPHYKNKSGEKVFGKLNYRIRVKPTFNIFKLTRKAELFSPDFGNYSKSTHTKVAIKNVEEIGIRPSVCIAVDNKNKLFLAGEYIVTHNSFLAAVGVALHEILTDGSKYYSEQALKDPPKNEIYVGSGMASKSSEMLAKTLDAMGNLPGTWKPGTSEESPAPLFKHMSGSLAPNNIKNPWRHEYEKKIGGEYKKIGSGSNIKHGTFTTENPEATAGGRYSVIIIEEVGLTNMLLTVLGSSDATMRTDGTDKYGSAFMLGTGGSVEKIVESEIVFRDPSGFDCLEFDDEWENTGKIGWFIPAYYADRKYKDSEGNTIIDKAFQNYEERRKLKKKAKSSSALDLEMMNYPLIPSEMFLTKTSNNYPIADLKHRLAELATNDKILNSTWKGRFGINSDGKVEWKNTDARPIREFPLKSDYSNMEGACEMFYPPQSDENGEIASGRYIASLDPVDEDDNSDVTTSLQSFLIMDTYLDRIVFEYSGRTKFAKDFYEQCRRALIYYKAALLYENQKKGVFTYFDTKNSLYLLADTPKALRDMDMQKISGVGNKTKGVYATPAINKWGREELGPAWMNSQAVGKPEGVNNAMVQKSPAFIREAILYNPNLNTDRISAFGILMIFRELRLKYVPKESDKDIYTPDKDVFWDKVFNKGKINSGYTRATLFNI